MTGSARAIILGVSAVMIIGGLALEAGLGQGWPLMSLGALLAASVLLEGRYRGTVGETAGRSTWQRTGERELDSETGRIVEVWFDPATGERRYLPIRDS